jgi:valyl-tRNA synthetase
VPRKAVVEDLKAQGLLENHEEHKHSVGHCYRCHTMVEPNLSKQWFVKAKILGQKAMDAVKTARPVSCPEHVEQNLLRLDDNIRDWCISRQIWWGHQIPAWTCRAAARVMVAMRGPRSAAIAAQRS